MKKQKIKMILMPALLLAGISFSHAKPSLKEMTSDKKAEKVRSKMPTSNLVGPGLKEHSFGLGLGQTFLNGDFDDNGEDKITADLFYNYSASYSFDFMTSLHYSEHKYQTRKTTLSGFTMGVKAKVYQFDSFSPFTLGGLGFYNPKTRRMIDGKLLDSSSKLTFGYHFGAGVELDLNEKFTAGMMAIYHNPFDVKQDNQPEIEGSYFKLLMTLFYTL